MIKRIYILFAVLLTALSYGQADFPEGIYSGAGVVVDGQVKINATPPMAPQDAARKDYVDGKITQAVTDGNTTQAPSSDAVYDVISLKVSGVGTINYLPKWSGTNTQVNSQIFDDGTSVGFGTATPEASLHIANGNALILDRYKPLPESGVNFLGRAFNGTKTTPTTVLDNEVVSVFGAIPYNGIDAEGVKAGLFFLANGNQSATNRGTKLDLKITPLNGLVPSKSVLHADTDRVLLSDASVVNAAPVAIGWFAKGEITGENSHKFQVVSDGLNPTISFGQFGGVGSAGNAGGHLWASRGTATSPSALQSGDYLWSWGFRGQGATTRAPSSANMSIRATENFTDTAHGTQILFGTNATGHNANLGRTSEFIMDQDGYFRAEKVEVQSYSNGKIGNLKLRYASSNPDSRSWQIVNDYDAFGDFSILQSTTQTGSTYAKIISVAPDGNATFTGKVKVANAVANDEAVTLGQMNTAIFNGIRSTINTTYTSTPSASTLNTDYPAWDGKPYFVVAPSVSGSPMIFCKYGPTSWTGFAGVIIP